MKKLIISFFTLVLLSLFVGFGYFTLTPTRQYYDEIDEDEESYIQEAPVPDEHAYHAYVLFVVLDDAGHMLDEVKQYDAFPGELTFSIIPRLRDSKLIADYLYQKKTPYLIHLPLEAYGNKNEGDFAIHTGYSESKILALLQYNFSEFDGYIGFNNHMGSKATEDAKLLGLILNNIPHNLLVLDSRTTKDTLLLSTAQEKQFLATRRDVFIDNVREVDYITQQIRKGIEHARQKGHAILIGHVMVRETAIALQNIYATVVNDGGVFWGLDKFGNL